MRYKEANITFINFSNHPHSAWSEQQLQCAKIYGDIKDISFPNVDAGLSADAVNALAEKSIHEILSFSPDCVLCQGEFTLSYAIISKLRHMGIKVVAACSERVVTQKINSNGDTEKLSVFKFVQFREYI